jgi:hypothetical protein
MMCLLFGTNALLFAIFQLIKKVSLTADGDEKKVIAKKELSKPFTGSVECFTNLTSELFRTSLIMALTYICENYWFFEHSQKSYSRDLFMFVLILFFAYAFYTIKPVHDLSLLGREQTEEWKGWMQFIFLLYHYFHAEEVYNSVRVMITCYVWMTGFGNFSFFYMKRDFGWVRVMQMLWRLNFAVLLLMWTHGNTYILYYICPMHTFYFLMVYATMYLMSSLNSSKWGIRIKIMALAVIIYIVWDVNHGLFDMLFFWLGTDKVVGAGNGSLWEYYFRTSLDHYSSLLGMVFALNFPLAEQYFHKASGYPLYIAAALMAAASVWWFLTCYSLEKMEYNLIHSYFAIIPLSAYIFFRNMTPGIRSGVSMSLHDLGKTTLETYLLQHHIWLSSNAKTLLTIIPGHPWMNFAVTTMMFFFVAKELYRLTMSLRGMIMPDDKQIMWTNCIGLAATLGGLFSLAGMVSLLLHSPSVLEVLLCCVLLTMGTLLLISKMGVRCAESGAFQTWSKKAMYLGVSVLVVGVIAQAVLYQVPPTSSSTASLGTPSQAYIGNTPLCLDAISKGKWVKVHCDTPDKASAVSKMAFCETNRWEWATTNCPVGRMSLAKSRSIYQGKQVVFVGDSVLRNTYRQFLTALDPDYSYEPSLAAQHSDITYVPPFDSTASMTFIWSPFIANVSSFYASAAVLDKYDMIVASASFWDALYIRDVKAYQTSVGKLMSHNGKAQQEGTVDGASPSHHRSINVWVLPTPIQTDMLLTAEKQRYMSEKIMTTYKAAFQSTGSGLFDTVVDPSSTVQGMEDSTMDGLHYHTEVYDVIAQMIMNGFSLHTPAYYTVPSAKPYKPKPTGSMSNPGLGLFVVVLTAIMLFLMDNWMGFGYLSMALFGVGYSWEEAYPPLLKKIERALEKEKDRSTAAKEKDSNANLEGGSRNTGAGDDHSPSPNEQGDPAVQEKESLLTQS